MNDSLIRVLRELIAEILEVEEKDIKPETDLYEDLGADSMSSLEIMFKIETDLGIALDVEEMASATTLTDLVRCVTSHPDFVADSVS